MKINQPNCIITGANSGIGYEASKSLANQGYHVIMWCRNAFRAEAAKLSILKQNPAASIETVIADLADKNQIIYATNYLLNNYSHIDVLIHNAACLSSNYQSTSENIELQWAVNFFAPFLITGKLLPLILQSKQGRIINVSSRAHYFENIVFNEIQNHKNYSGKKAYGSSKLALILFSNYLALQLKNTKVTVNSMYPGLVNTNFGYKNTPIFYQLYWMLVKQFGKSPKQGADTIVYLASAEELSHVTGKYFGNRKIKFPSIEAQDIDLAKKLWCYAENNLNFKYNFDALISL